MEATHDDEAIQERTEELHQETVLSPKQAAVQARTEAGWSRREIAEDLGMEITTVDSHRQNIKRKREAAERTLAEIEA